MNNIRALRNKNKLTMKELSKILGVAESTISLYENEKRQPDNDTLCRLADYFNVSIDYLLGRDETSLYKQFENEDITYFEVIGSVKAGYNSEAIEEHTGEFTPIPTSFLKGRSKDDFFVLRVSGDSMYPRLLDGDLVLVQRASIVDSGSVAVVLYNGNESTVKRINYVPGEDWVELIPFNPEYKTKRIEGIDLELCIILGKVVKLIRDI